MKKVAIIGAGFSGLSLAWALKKRGIACEIFEKENRSGGMISTENEKILFESAANAVIASADFEALCADVGVDLVSAGFKSNARYIFRGAPKRIPFGLFKFIKIVVQLLFAKLTGSLAPLDQESVRDWGTRIVDAQFVDYLVEPALQGIYAVPADRLNAKLVINGFLDHALRPERGRLKGSVSPSHGMGELLTAIGEHLKNNGVNIHFSRSFKEFDSYAAVVYAGSLRFIDDGLRARAPLLTDVLAKLPLAQVSTVIIGFQNERNLKGFGCLFPRSEGFRSLGVLFNTDIFPHRGRLESESWIFSSADKDVSHYLNLALEDRKRLTGLSETPEIWRVNSWNPALPVYGEELRKALTSQIFTDAGTDFDVFKKGARVRESSQPLYLTGNFLGGIGLARILKYNKQLAERIEREI